MDIEAIGSYAADGSVRLYDTNSLALDDVNSAELYASDGTPYYHSLEFKSQKPIDITYDNAFVGRYYARQLKIKNKRDVQLTAYSMIWLLKLYPRHALFFEGTTVYWVMNRILPRQDPTLYPDAIQWSVDSDLMNQKVYGFIPAGTAYSQLFELLIALGAGCYVEPNGWLRIRYPTTEPFSTVGADRLVIGSSIENKSPITYLSVTCYDYVKQGNVQEIFRGTISGEQYIYFDEPHCDFKVSGVTSYTESYTYICLEGNGSEVVVSADSYNVLEGTVTRGTEPTGIDTDNTKSISNHRLIWSENASAVADRLWSYYTAPQTFKGTIICKGEHAGDVINLYRPDTKETIIATVYKMRYQFGNSECRATIEALLNFVPVAKDMSGFTNYEILTGSGTFTVPSTATDIYIVMVSGGKGGTAGYDGESTEESKYYGHSAYQHLNAGKGGKGGECGAGASGGKIYYTVISNVAGSSFSYSCGAGGAGGTEAGGEGSDGAKTTFGNYSTENGKVFAGGYTRKLPDDTYITLGATNADNGIAGSDGSAGGTFDIERYDAVTETHSGTEVIVKEKYRVIFADGDFGNSAYEHMDRGYYIDDWHYWEDTNLPMSTVCQRSAIACGGGRGGICSGITKGQAGGDASASYDYDRIFEYYEFFATAGIGGNGASPAARTQASGYGQGGAGGHGGGGCGGCGEAECNVDSWELDAKYLTTTQPACVGGSFGRGGQGGDGAILVLYN